MCSGSAKPGNAGATLVRVLGPRLATQDSCAQNKTPRTRFESETYVDQPSPKCCSRRSIDTAGEVENGTEVLYLGHGFLRGQNSVLI